MNRFSFIKQKLHAVGDTKSFALLVYKNLCTVPCGEFANRKLVLLQCRRSGWIFRVKIAVFVLTLIN